MNPSRESTKIAGSASGSAAGAAGSLLCTINYPANSGYAWAFIEGLCGRIADELRPAGVTTYVAYPAIPDAPRALAGTAAVPVVLHFADTSWRDALRLWREVRRLGVRVAYVSDQLPYSWRYALLRLAGVRWVVVHSHSSGGAPPARGLRRLAKLARARLAWLGPDVYVTVSDFVAQRDRAAALVPERRTRRIWNALPLPDAARAEREGRRVREELGLAPETLLVFMGSRAMRTKGVQHLLRAFDTVVRETGLGPDRLRLAYAGDGPQLEEFREIARSLASASQITIAGHRTDVPGFLAAADVVAVPSVIEDALPLAVLEAMTHGRPVVGSSIGGIPEMARHEQEGLLVPPGDEAALAAALRRLIEDAPLRRTLGARARARAAEHFGPAGMVEALVSTLREGWARTGGAGSPEVAANGAPGGTPLAREPG